jgi:hypothetical protein
MGLGVGVGLEARRDRIRGAMSIRIGFAKQAGVRRVSRIADSMLRKGPLHSDDMFKAIDEAQRGLGVGTPRVGPGGTLDTLASAMGRAEDKISRRAGRLPGIPDESMAKMVLYGTPGHQLASAGLLRKHIRTIGPEAAKELRKHAEEKSTRRFRRYSAEANKFKQVRD